MKDITGQNTDILIKGTVMSELGGLLGKMADAGSIATGSMSHDEFEGLTRDATTIASAGDRECRTQLFPKMVEALSATSERREYKFRQLQHRGERERRRQQHQLRGAVRGKAMTPPRIGQSPPSRRRWRFPSRSAALALGLATLALQAELAFADSKIDTGQCSVAVAGSAVGNSITCNFGLTPEQLKQLTEAAVRGATDAQQEHVDKVSKTLGLTESAAKNLLKIVGDDANVPEDKLAEALTKAAEDYRRLQTQVAALNPGNPSARALVDQAKSEIESGNFEQAHKLLREATQAQIAAAQEARRIRERAQAAEDAQWLGAASSTAAEGDVALTERKFDQAARLFGQAAGYVSSDHKKERGDYLLRQADALYREGGERGDNNALREAIEVCRSALARIPAFRSPAPLGEC